MRVYELHIELIDKTVCFGEIVAEIKKICLENELEEKLIISESDINLKVENLKTEESHTYPILQLLIFDKNEKLSYAFGEDFEIKDIEHSIYNKNKDIIPSKILNELEENFDYTEKDYKLEEIQNFLDEFYVDKSIFITGSKPMDLFGYNLNHPGYQKMAEDIYKNLEKLIVIEDYRYFITNGNLGTQMITFFAIQILKQKYPNIRNILVLPFLHIDEKWDTLNKKQFQWMLKTADMVLQVDKITPYKNYFYAPVGSYEKSKYPKAHDFVKHHVSETLYVSKIAQNQIKISRIQESTTIPF